MRISPLLLLVSALLIGCRDRDANAGPSIQLLSATATCSADRSTGDVSLRIRITLRTSRAPITFTACSSGSYLVRSHELDENFCPAPGSSPSGWEDTQRRVTIDRAPQTCVVPISTISWGASYRLRDIHATHVSLVVSLAPSIGSSNALQLIVPVRSRAPAAHPDAL